MKRRGDGVMKIEWRWCQTTIMANADVSVMLPFGSNPNTAGQSVRWGGAKSEQVSGRAMGKTDGHGLLARRENDSSATYQMGSKETHGWVVGRYTGGKPSFLELQAGLGDNHSRAWMVQEPAKNRSGWDSLRWPTYHWLHHFQDVSSHKVPETKGQSIGPQT